MDQRTNPFPAPSLSASAVQADLEQTDVGIVVEREAAGTSPSAPEAS